MTESYTFHPIGTIHSNFVQRAGMPCQTARASATGKIEVFEEYEAGLQDIEGFSHIMLLYVFHQTTGPELVVKPFLDDREHGLFSTRHPDRPNPIGISVVELVERDGRLLHVRGLDVLDSTPLLDIKPYVPKFDHHPATRTGWLEGQEDERPWEANFD